MSRAETGDVRCFAHAKEREMTALIMLVKGLMLIALAFVAFTALAVALGFEPAPADEFAKCDASPVPVCLFTII